MVVLIIAALVSLILGILLDRKVIPVAALADDTGPQWVDGLAIIIVVIIIGLVSVSRTLIFTIGCSLAS